jgi:sporulation protein YlmC with PRC-barrel domain
MIIPGQGKFMGIIGKEDSLSIPWTDIVRIGSDVILVQMKDRIGSPGQSKTE